MNVWPTPTTACSVSSSVAVANRMVPGAPWSAGLASDLCANNPPAKNRESSRLGAVIVVPTSTGLPGGAEPHRHAHPGAGGAVEQGGQP